MRGDQKYGECLDLKKLIMIKHTLQLAPHPDSSNVFIPPLLPLSEAVLGVLFCVHFYEILKKIQ